MPFCLILIIFTVNLAACSSVNKYIKTQRSQYLNSQELPLLKIPAGLQISREERYIIPRMLVVDLSNYLTYSRQLINSNSMIFI